MFSGLIIVVVDVNVIAVILESIGHFSIEFADPFMISSCHIIMEHSTPQVPFHYEGQQPPPSAFRIAAAPA